MNFEITSIVPSLELSCTHMYGSTRSYRRWPAFCNYNSPFNLLCVHVMLWSCSAVYRDHSVPYIIYMYMYFRLVLRRWLQRCRNWIPMLVLFWLLLGFYSHFPFTVQNWTPTWKQLLSSAPWLYHFLMCSSGRSGLSLARGCRQNYLTCLTKFLYWNLRGASPWEILCVTLGSPRHPS